MQLLEDLVLTSERLLRNVLNLITYIRSKLEDKVNMEGSVGKHRSIIGLFFLCIFLLFNISINCRWIAKFFFFLRAICLKQHLFFIFIGQVVCLYILFGYLEILQPAKVYSLPLKLSFLVKLLINHNYSLFRNLSWSLLITLYSCLKKLLRGQGALPGCQRTWTLSL